MEKALRYSQKELFGMNRFQFVLLIILGLLAFGVICLVTTLLLGNIPTNIISNIPFLSNAKFEIVSGKPAGIPAGIAPALFLYTGPTVLNDILITVKYPIEISQGKTVKLIITCTNNSNQPAENFIIFINGKTTLLGNYNYFDGLSVYSTDRQVLESGYNVSGGFVSFDAVGINPGNSKEITLNIAAGNIGVYGGGI